ncbi:hypothetical protein [Roseibium suaedae]|uniref:Serine/threonine protein kinase n=1 Tax=Roseibium suaedae TaxID=735517 RepID=A0A1M6ZBB0_9HYPH|nr:hypothetical protein [Roseibium suaedae]SHL27679.1 hypothetical protein SAMN05444272_0186 [Roseibium suaedae]
MRIAVLLCLAAVLAALLLMKPAEAQTRVYCPLPEHGTWINPKAAPKELTRLEIVTKCVDNTVQVRVRAFTKCIPRDCKWGWTEGQAWPDGGIRVVLVGFFGSKQFDLRAVGDRMDAYVTNAFHDPVEQDTVKSYILRRK